MAVKHQKVLAKPDNGNSGAVQSADWNGDHVLTGMLALLDALSGQANKVMTFDASGNPELLPKASILSGNSPAFTGIPTAPTASPGTNTDQIATTAFTQAAVAALVASAPGLLNTLDELAQALGDDPNFATTVTALINLRATIASPTFTGTPAAPTPAVGDVSTRIATAAFVNANNAARGHISGLTLSTAGSSSTFSVAAGLARDAADTITMRLASSLAKTTASWAVGAGGSLDTDTIANSTWYHVYEIMRTDTGVVDVCISLSASAPTFGSHINAAYTKYRRIGSLLTNGSGQWVKFFQYGDDFVWDTMVADHASASLGTSGVFYALTVPNGLKVLAKIAGIFVNGSAGAMLLLTSPEQADSSPSLSNFLVYVGAASENESYTTEVRTDGTRQIRGRSSAASSTLYINTIGWRDTRGQYD